MNAIKATVKDGRLEVPVPPDWPDGMEVEIYPRGCHGTQENDEPLGPEEIRRLLALMDRIQPWVMTNEELAAWDADRQASKEREKAHLTKLCRQCFGSRATQVSGDDNIPSLDQ